MSGRAIAGRAATIHPRRCVSPRVEAAAAAPLVDILKGFSTTSLVQRAREGKA
jgi:hypothetical protein